MDGKQIDWMVDVSQQICGGSGGWRVVDGEGEYIVCCICRNPYAVPERQTPEYS